MNRLLTAGCSFTKHCWNTWAEYLGREYDWHKQLGIGGSDNATIARNVISSAKGDDTVVVMWTGYDRWSFYDTKWNHNGSLVSNKDFYTKYYSPYERFVSTMDYVQMVDNHAKINGYTCYHFSAFQWLLSEVHKTIPDGIIDVYSSCDISNNHIFPTSLFEFQEHNNEIIPISHKYDDNDIHPTPLTQWKFLNEIIKPSMGFETQPNVPLDVMKDQSNVINGIIS